jgi:hypothetical protein
VRAPKKSTIKCAPNLKRMRMPAIDRMNLMPFSFAVAAEDETITEPAARGGGGECDHNKRAFGTDLTTN